MKRTVWIVALAVPALCLFAALALTWPPPFLDARDLNAIDIYAYRDWQGTSVQVETGDQVSIQARGEWLYTPGEWHGPQGHARYPAPSFYPIPNVAGGVLIGRIGDQGPLFVVGQGIRFAAPLDGQLYLRIDDDILSDNEGKVQVEITVVHPTTPSPPSSRGQPGP